MIFETPYALRDHVGERLGESDGLGHPGQKRIGAGVESGDSGERRAGDAPADVRRTLEQGHLDGGVGAL